MMGTYVTGSVNVIFNDAHDLSSLKTIGRTSGSITLNDTSVAEDDLSGMPLQ